MDLYIIFEQMSIQCEMLKEKTASENNSQKNANNMDCVLKVLLYFILYGIYIGISHSLFIFLKFIFSSLDSKSYQVVYLITHY